MAFDLAKSGFGDRAEMSNLDKIKMIPLTDICKNDQNFYSMTGIDELAESIAMVGLLNPVSVIADNGKYRLVSGHRRFEAYYKLWLGADPASDAGRRYSKIPAIILRDMDDLKETFALVTANSTARDLSYDEKLKQEQVLRDTIQAMKDAGMDVPRNIGQYIADQMGVSRNEVSRMHSVNKNLIPEAREKVAAGEMTACEAYDLSRKTEAEQKESFVADLSQKYAEDSAKRANHLNKFVRDRGVSLAQCSIKRDVVHRFQSISELQKQFRGRGGSSLGYSWTSSGKGLEIRASEYENDRLYSWTEIWDALALYAIGKLANMHDSTPAAWCSGTPEKSGEYVAVFDASGIHIKRLCYYDLVVGQWMFSKGGSVINATCIMWVRVPED